MSKGEKRSYELQNGVMGNGYETEAPSVHLERPVYLQEDLNKYTLYERPHKTVVQSVGELCANFTLGAYLLARVPFLGWIKEYNWAKSFPSDIISGITVAIMHIPQGMAYGLLGNVPPVVGIYMAFFPVLIYFFFGTSKHVSIGTFAIVCLMTGKVVSDYSTIEIMQNGTIRQLQENGGGLEDAPSYTNVQVAVTVTFTVACIQLVMFVLQLGVISTLLSETLVNGFTSASAFHIVCSQIKDLFGLPTKKRRGNFSLLYTLYDAAMAVPQANINATVISVIVCLLLILNNELFKPWLAKRTKVPVPIELIAVILGTAVSTIFNMSANYGISTVGHIPKGMPAVSLPAFELIPSIFLDSFVITMVSYTITMSMALIFARKLMYEVNSNQELLALGLSNTMGSFFSCMPVTASLSRSMIQQTIGGVSQFASVVSCCILLVILLWVGPFFESLPRCVLASIIVIALKGIIFQCKEIVKYWKLSKWDAMVWIVTFVTTLVFQISYGLAVGVAVSLLSIFLQGHKPYTCLLGVVPNTDLYLDLKRYKGVQEIAGVKIFHYAGGINFASRTSFKETLTKRLGFDVAEVYRRRIKMETDENNCNTDELLIQSVVFDFSSVTFIDPSGVDLLRQLQADFQRLNIGLYISSCSGPVFEVMKRCDATEKRDSKFVIFPTVHDAILYAQQCIVNKTE